MIWPVGRKSRRTQRAANSRWRIAPDLSRVTRLATSETRIETCGRHTSSIGVDPTHGSNPARNDDYRGITLGAPRFSPPLPAPGLFTPALAQQPSPRARSVASPSPENLLPNDRRIRRGAATRVQCKAAARARGRSRSLSLVRLRFPR